MEKDKKQLEFMTFSYLLNVMSEKELEELRKQNNLDFEITVEGE